MVAYIDTLTSLGINFVPLIRTLMVIVVVYISFSLIIRVIKRSLLKHAKDKRHKTDIINFSRMIKIVFILFLVLIAIFSYTGSFTGLGVAAGLFTAALGWALQRPITGIAAWIMVVVKRPFIIGDRIIIGEVKGDVREITLTHIILEEVGGLVNAEVVSGRIIMIPNYQLYELNIINYTKQHEFVIGESVVQVTYESDLNKAMKIVFATADKYAKEGSEKLKHKPMVRVMMAGSGIDLKVRFYAPAYGIQKVTSDITEEIYHKISKNKDVEIAYPHTELVFKDKKLFKNNKK